jgi:thymidylate synthase
MRRLDYTYSLPPYPVWDWRPGAQSGLFVYDEGYLELPSRVTPICNALRDNPDTRQAVLVLNKGITYMSCLISIQWLIMDNRCRAIAHFRSQHETLGRPGDSKLLQHLHTLVMDALPHCTADDITVHVGDYHYYPLTKKSI